MTGPAPVADERPFHAAFAHLLAGRPSGILADGPADAFCAWAVEHRLGPYAGHITAEVDRVLGPRLRATTRTAAIKEMMYGPPTRKLLAALVGAGVTPIVFKGLGVAHLCYPEPYLRPLGDLDLLFRPADLTAVVDTCLSLGYRHQNPDPAIVAFYTQAHYNVPLVHPEFGLLEAHHQLYGDCEDAFTRALFDRCVDTTVLGAPVQRPASPDLFILLALHWGISSPGSSWMWLLDLVLLGRMLTDDDWQNVLAQSQRHGLQIFTATALGFLRHLWDVDFAGRAPEAPLRASLRVLERLAVDRACALAGVRTLGAHFLAVARRASGRPVRESRRLLRAVICHPGVVVDEMRVSSLADNFWMYRLAHPWWRLTRAAESIYKAVSRT